jgi:hypothetical protein
MYKKNHGMKRHVGKIKFRQVWVGGGFERVWQVRKNTSNHLLGEGGNKFGELKNIDVTVGLSINPAEAKYTLSVTRMVTRTLGIYGLKVTHGENILAEMNEKDFVHVDNLVLRNLFISNQGGKAEVNADHLKVDTKQVLTKMIKTKIGETFENEGTLSAESMHYRGLGENAFTFKIIKPKVDTDLKIKGDSETTNLSSLQKLIKPLVTTESVTIEQKSKNERDYILEKPVLKLNLNDSVTVEGLIPQTVVLKESKEEFTFEEEKLVLQNATVAYIGKKGSSGKSPIPDSLLEDLDKLNSSKLSIFIHEKEVAIDINNGSIDLMQVRTGIANAFAQNIRDNQGQIFNNAIVDFFRAIIELQDYYILVQTPNLVQRMIFQSIVAGREAGFAAAIEVVINSVLIRDNGNGVTEAVLVGLGEEDTILRNLCETKNILAGRVKISKLIDYQINGQQPPPAATNQIFATLNWDEVQARLISLQDEDGGLSAWDGDPEIIEEILQSWMPAFIERWLIQDLNMSLDFNNLGPKTVLEKMPTDVKELSSIDLSLKMNLSDASTNNKLEATSLSVTLHNFKFTVKK